MFSVSDLLVLTRIPNIGGHRLRALVTHFGDPSKVAESSARSLAGVPGFTRNLASHVAHFFHLPEYDEARRYAERQLARLESVGGEILHFWDPRYPDILRKIYDPPALLFLRGSIEEKDRICVAIVGTREPTDYGSNLAEQFSRGLAGLGITIVSGLARGIDTIAHSTAVRNKGRTLAVTGSGLDIFYPPENRLLSQKIAECGAVMSEYPMGTKPDAVNFPRRNRIISGLSFGTLIVETDIDGGAMITASMALDQNREVFAIPGPVHSRRTKGCHALIREGRAKLVETVDDLLAELPAYFRVSAKVPACAKRPLPELTLFEKKLYDVLAETPLHIDLIAERSELSVPDTLVNLLSLEFKGVIRQLAGKMFVRVG